MCTFEKNRMIATDWFIGGYLSSCKAVPLKGKSSTALQEAGKRINA